MRLAVKYSFFRNKSPSWTFCSRTPVDAGGHWGFEPWFFQLVINPLTAKIPLPEREHWSIQTVTLFCCMCSSIFFIMHPHTPSVHHHHHHHQHHHLLPRRFLGLSEQPAIPGLGDQHSDHLPPLESQDGGLGWVSVVGGHGLHGPFLSSTTTTTTSTTSSETRQTVPS